jgi:ATP-dependent RNA helicase RhlE
MAFQTLGLTDELVRGILATGYTAPTEIQSRAIPIALTGKDIIATAKTGTGKTAAFVLPMLQKLASSPQKGHHCRALVLTPTRELAHQIEDSVTNYGRFLNVRALAIYGGTNMQNQLKRLGRGVDVVIATPGRLLDHLSRRSINLSHVEVLVLDEADRMFDMGFINDVKKIVAHIPKERQTMMFSATIDKPIRELMSAIQKHPTLIEIGEQRLPVETVRQSFYSVPKEKKIDLLLFMLEQKELDSVLVFSRTKHGADKISRRLERRGIKSIAIHSDRTQAQRERALSGFRNGQYRVMVATDVAARGIDVEGISHVVNFDIPNFPEDYIHRIGRTGRALATGDAITFVAHDEVDHLRRLERFTSKRHELKKFPGFDDRKISSQPETSEAPQPRRSHSPHKKKHSLGRHGGRVHQRGRRDKFARPHSKPTQAQPNLKEYKETQEHKEPKEKEKKDWRSVVTEIADTFLSKKRRKKWKKR